MFYPATTKAVEILIQGVAPGITGQQLAVPKCGPVSFAHLLWMIEEIRVMDTDSVDAAIKAGRYIGWVLREVESQGFWDNEHTRDLVRGDVQNGFHRPH